MNDGVFAALLSSSAGKFLGAVGGLLVAALGGWFASRASIMHAVNQRVDALLGHMEAEIARLTAAHAACDIHVARLSDEVELIRGELRQAKQTIESMERVK